jgi:Double zinc ribbon
MHRMDNDERERLDRPDANEGEASEPDRMTTPDDGEPPIAAPHEEDATASEESTSSADIESWPSQDAAASDRAWPTEPPDAGSSTGWPTEPPERGDEPVLEPPAETAAPAPDVVEPGADAVEPIGAAPVAPIEPDVDQPPTAEPPPGEVEAYPAAPPLSDARDEERAAIAAAAAAHTVPADESVAGEGTQCPRCGTENRPGLAFCRNCGQRLVAAGVSTTVERPGTPEGTMACPRCGTHNRTGVAFCQNCGANLRAGAPGYVPPAAAVEAAVGAEGARGGAILGPVVLLIGLVGLVTAYLLPFAYGGDSLFDRAFGPDGYGVSFWTFGAEGGMADGLYFSLAAAVPLLGLLLLALAIAGFIRAAPGPIQMAGLIVALVWSVALIVLFLVVEVAASWGGDIVGLLRELTPAGIILFLASLIVVIGVLTRFGRG